MVEDSQAARVLRFDDFELDTHALELRKKGVRLRLQGQPLLVLEALMRRAGDLVTREELRAQIWHGDTFVDFDHSLHNAIARLREVLGDSADSPRYIETLPRRGYRFIPAVECVFERSVSAPQHRADRIGDVSEVRAVAVLPFINLSADPENEFFADGMTEDVIAHLAKIRSIKVISRTSVMAFKRRDQSLREIGEKLGAAALLDGSVRRAGNRVRIVAELVNAATDEHI